MNSSGLFCSQCGQLNDMRAEFCVRCGAPQPHVTGPATAAAAAAPLQAPMPVQAQAPIPDALAYSAPPAPPVYGAVPPLYPPPPPNAAGIFRGYAGFWIRFLAVLIDGLVVGVVAVPVMLVLLAIFGVFGALSSARMGEPSQQAAAMALFTAMPIIVLSMVSIGWLYEAVMTSSEKQATLGKMALHLKVTTREGNRMSFGHATGRHFAKLINNFTFYVGWIMAGFTERKQGLHDLICGTYVIKT